MRKKEIQEKLVALGIEFEDDATNKELLALLPEEVEETPEETEETTEEVTEDDEELSPADKKLSPFLRAYKKQNLRKFKTKLANGELDGL